MYRHLNIVNFELEKEFLGTKGPGKK